MVPNFQFGAENECATTHHLFPSSAQSISSPRASLADVHKRIASSRTGAHLRGFWPISPVPVIVRLDDSTRPNTKPPPIIPIPAATATMSSASSSLASASASQRTDVPVPTPSKVVRAPLNIYESFLCGGLAGCAAVTVCESTWTIRVPSSVRRQTDRGTPHEKGWYCDAMRCWAKRYKEGNRDKGRADYSEHTRSHEDAAAAPRGAATGRQQCAEGVQERAGCFRQDVEE